MPEPHDDAIKALLNAAARRMEEVETSPHGDCFYCGQVALEANALRFAAALLKDGDKSYD